jgi:hypothetical protein
MGEHDEERQNDEEGIPHAWVFEEINISPEGSDKQCHISNNSQYSVNSNDE